MIIDLRSDTVTRPTPGMLANMLQAPLGDDVFMEDPTVKMLEEKAAALFGHENALFCPSGTMTNQIAVKILTLPAEEIICDRNSHVYMYEGGGLAFNSGVSARLIQGNRGRIYPDQILENINPDQVYHPVTSLVVLENTSNRGGGSYYTLPEMAAINSLCRQKKLKIHLDGARIFNALAETKDSPLSTGSLFDTISVCLSKGLGAPAGSLLISSAENIKKARRVRKILGGGMRQSGILAAAGIYALDHHISRLPEDHRRARELAGLLMEQSWVEDIFPVDTNIILFKLSGSLSPENFIEKMKARNILMATAGGGYIRAVTHLDFTDDMLEVTLRQISRMGQEK